MLWENKIRAQLPMNEHGKNENYIDKEYIRRLGSFFEVM